MSYLAAMVVVWLLVTGGPVAVQKGLQQQLEHRLCDPPKTREDRESGVYHA